MKVLTRVKKRSGLSEPTLFADGIRLLFSYFFHLIATVVGHFVLDFLDLRNREGSNQNVQMHRFV